MVCQTLFDKQLRIAEQCAPVLADVKASNLLLLENTSTEEVRRITEASGTELCFLYRGEKKSAWLLYREEKLKRILRREENRRFLREYGYREFSAEAVLERFSERAKAYLKGETAYPHELGLLLGYPLCDVRGFIECGGKDFLYCGYWKIYGDVEKAKRTSALYYRVRREAINKVIGGKVK